MAAAWSDHDEWYDRQEARGEVSDDALGGYYESWRQDDDVFVRLSDAITESARLGAELAETLRLIA